MKEEKILYFSPAEFMVLLELAEGPECSFLSDGTVPEEEALAMAFTTLFQRELIQRRGTSFVLAGAGEMFHRIRNAPWAVYLSGQTGNTALCYPDGESCYLVELADVILTVQYRVRQLDRTGLERWLFESGLLEFPMLTEEDVSELAALLAEEPEVSEIQPVFRFEKHVNGGPITAVYEMYKNRGRWRVRQNGGDDIYYTQEALSELLTDCFGKEDK